MRVAVTGAGGFIGRHVVAGLAKAGHQVLAVTHRPDEVEGAAETRDGDVADQTTWSFAAEVDAIVHLAGISDASLSFARPLDYNLANALGTLRGLEAARVRGTRFLLASSQRIYQSSLRPASEEMRVAPRDPYGYSKLVAEEWLAMYRRLFDLPALILRFFSVYGPGQVAGSGASGVVAIFVDRAVRGADLVAQTDAYRDFTYVEDVVQGVRLALEKSSRTAELYNIATGTATSMIELATAVREVTGSRSRIVASEGTRPPESYVADISRAQDELGYCPAIPLTEGLKRYVASIR